MGRKVQVYADMVLSFNGEDLVLSARCASITVTPPSLLSGLRTLNRVNAHHDLARNIKRINAVTAQLGWTLYARIGLFKFALLGTRAKGHTLTSLLLLSRLVTFGRPM